MPLSGISRAKAMSDMTLKRSMYLDVEASGVPRKVLADLVGTTEGTLSNALDEGNPTAAISVAKLLRLLHVTGGHHTLTYLAALCGHVVCKLPARATVEGTTAQTVREFAELLEEVAGAQDDGRIDPDEAARIVREGREAIAAIAALLDTVELRKRPDIKAVAR